MGGERPSTHEKALRINLDAARYGTFAEIGAAQEVARWFFRVGGASGTVAKSMSAYDMAFSDAIYGPAERYVCRTRLLRMLDHEYGLLLERLGAIRGRDTAFFVFADTVAARRYRGGDESHGWMGVKFQHGPGEEPSNILMHVRMLDPTSVQQQEALGTIGVNLVYGAFYHRDQPEVLIDSLLDGLTPQRIQVDMIKFEGEVFRGISNRLMSLHLVRRGLTQAAMFSAAGEVLQPSEVFYGKVILIERGTFRPVTRVNLAMLESARRHLATDPATAGKEIVELAEITMKNLLREGEIDPRDFIMRADILGALGKNVLISNYAEFHRLAAYLSLSTRERIAIVLGVPLLRELMDEKYYENLEGGILESFGRLFKKGTRLYVYPARDRETGAVVDADTVDVAAHLRKLYGYLRENRFIERLEPVGGVVYGQTVAGLADRIGADEAGWEEAVDPRVAKIIRERGFFGARPAASETAFPAAR